MQRRSWLNENGVQFDLLQMRPTTTKFKWMKDDLLKKHWLDTLLNKDDILCVFDDRDKVVQMWRDNDIDCFQVADGNFLIMEKKLKRGKDRVLGGVCDGLGNYFDVEPLLWRLVFLTMFFIPTFPILFIIPYFLDSNPKRKII